MPSAFISHGGGPLPILEPQQHEEMYASLNAIAKSTNPRAVIVFSAHWECAAWTILDNDNPGLLFDYGGFPQESYHYKYLATSSKALRDEIRENLAPLELVSESKRGYDHGVFIPLMIMYPKADIPVIQISLMQNLDPLKHYQMGVALRGLEKRGFLILGSGSSLHGGFHNPKITEMSKEFDTKLSEKIMKSTSEEENLMLVKGWKELPHVSIFHSREEHLVPLFVCLGVKEPSGQKRRMQFSLWNAYFSNYFFE